MNPARERLAADLAGIGRRGGALADHEIPPMNKTGWLARGMLTLSALASLLFCVVHVLSYLPIETPTLLSALDWMAACSMLAVCVCTGGMMASDFAYNVGLRAASPWLKGLLLLWGVYACVLLGVSATHRVPGRLSFWDGQYRLVTEDADVPGDRSSTELTGERLQTYSRYVRYRLRAWSALSLAAVAYASAFYLSCLRRAPGGNPVCRPEGGADLSGLPPAGGGSTGRGSAGP